MSYDRTLRTRPAAQPITLPGVLAHRIVLSPNQQELPRHLMFAVVNRPGTSDLSITLVAPGLKRDALVQTRTDLVQRLRAALKPTVPAEEIPAWDNPLNEKLDHTRWVYRVSERDDDENPEPTLRISIGDSVQSNGRTASALLKILEGLLTPLAEAHYRRVVVIAPERVYVPLAFDYDDLTPDHIEVTLPPELKLVRTTRWDDEHHADEITRNCLALERTLKVVLGLNRRVSNILVNPTSNDCARIAVMLSSRDGRITAGTINGLMAEICRLVKLHTVKDDYFWDTDIRPENQAAIQFDDGSEPHELHDEEY